MTGKPCKRRRRTLAFFKRHGFDQTYRTEDGHYRVVCGQCEALVINDQPCHERGCPNEKKGTK